jgi:ABC-2 type transport system permease protein
MFEQLLSGPFTRAQYIMSIILATLVIGVASSLMVFAIAIPVLGGGLSFTLQGQLLVACALFLGTLFFGTFAIAISVALRSSETFQVVSTFAFFVFLFTSSVFYPPDAAPQALEAVSNLNPLTYTTNIFRAGLFNAVSQATILQLGVLGVEAFAMFGLAVLAFRRIRV